MAREVRMAPGCGAYPAGSNTDGADGPAPGKGVTDMLRKLGFTLVELLVVMAIISILAAIAVPNITAYIARARMTRAQTEIGGIETSLIKMLADSGRNSLNQLFNAQGVADILATSGDSMFEAQQIYTSTLYALLREGRIALSDSDPETLMPYSSVLDVSAVSKLGTSYMDVKFDPWGKMYQIFPGPWNINNGPVIFRTYQRDQSEDSLPGSQKRDTDVQLAGRLFTAPVENLDTGETLDVGYAAARDQVAFIYSSGQNMVTGQMIYIPFWWNVPNLNVKALYDANQEEQYFGGGDDVNNWDKGASWERFY